MPNPIEALRLFLQADADVTAEVSGRVFGRELPASETTSMPRKCVIVKPVPNTPNFGGGYQQFGDIRVDVWCYGETPFEAGQVWQAVHPALKQLRRVVFAQCLVHWANPSGGPASDRDPDADWPFCWSAWEVLVAEVAVT